MVLVRIDGPIQVELKRLLVGVCGRTRGLSEKIDWRHAPTLV